MVGDSEPVAGAKPAVKAEKVTLKVSLYVSSSKITESFFLRLQKTDVGTPSLATIRRFIAAEPQHKEFALYRFCTKTGATVPDTWMTSDYLSVLEVDVDKAKVLDIYMKKKINKPRSEASAVEAPLIDLKLPTGHDTELPSKLVELKSRYDADTWRATSGDTDKKYPADLQEKEWSIVAQNNGLCHGFSIVRRKDGSQALAKGVARAKLAAFEFKPRNIPAYLLTNEDVTDVELSLRVPDFILDDHAEVTVFETHNDFQSAMFDNSFSEEEIKLAVEGSGFGFSFGASAGYGHSSNVNEQSATMKESSKLNVAYNFPRVSLLLDEDNLSLTTHCQAALGAVEDPATLKDFLDKYGEFFTTKTQFGGRLYGQWSS